MSKAYYAEIPSRSTEVLELRPFDDLTNRGAKIVDVMSDSSSQSWAQEIQFPSRIISISGERVTQYTYKNIRRMLDKVRLPVRFRMEPILKTKTSFSSSSNMPSETDSESETDNNNKQQQQQQWIDCKYQWFLVSI
eukprot:UN02109